MRYFTSRMLLNNKPNSILIFILILAVFLTGLVSPVLAKTTMEQDQTWETLLKDYYFPDKLIVESNELLDFTVPARAEDGAMVPIHITAKNMQTEQSYIKKIWLIIDKNPKPLAGVFHFTPKNGRADLSLRIRIDAYSPVRAIAETNSGQLYMVSHFVKSSGGCSAPASTDMEAALARLGKIRFKSPAMSSLIEPLSARLAISHPNTSGLQKDQITTMFIPPHYVSQVDVEFEGEPVFSAETDISISENPNFKFYFIPNKPGTLSAKITDTKGNVFTQNHKVDIAR